MQLLKQLSYFIVFLFSFSLYYFWQKKRKKGVQIYFLCRVSPPMCTFLELKENWTAVIIVAYCRNKTLKQIGTKIKLFSFGLLQ